MKVIELEDFTPTLETPTLLFYVEEGVFHKTEEKTKDAKGQGDIKRFCSQFASYGFEKVSLTGGSLQNAKKFRLIGTRGRTIARSEALNYAKALHQIVGEPIVFQYIYNDIKSTYLLQDE